MKNIAKSLIILMGIMAMSCTSDDTEDRPVIHAGTGLELMAPADGAEYVLAIENAAVQAERFVWTEAEFGQPIAATYSVEMDKAGNNFAAPAVIGSAVSGNNAAVTVGLLNSSALNLGGEPGVSANYEVRVKATINETVEPIYSNVVQIKVTPYQLFVPAQDLFLVGDATDYGWSNNNGNAPLFRDPENQFLYHFRGYFNAGGFKVLSALNSWHPQYGSTAAGVLGVSNADGSNEPGQIMVASAGYYDFTMNTQDMTYTFELFNAGGATTYGSMGITGSATPDGWPDNGVQDYNMTHAPSNPHLWKVEGIVLSAAEAKFRADDSWTNNWGGTTPIVGVGQFNGSSNIPVAIAGTYNVWFNDLDGRYIFIAQ